MMGEFIDNVSGKANSGDAGDGDSDGDSAANYRGCSDAAHNALMDTPLLLSEDDYDSCTHHRTGAGAVAEACTIAEQGFHRVDEDRSSSSAAKRQLIMAIALCFIFMVAEIVGGYMAGSLAIMADAAHLLTDCISFIVSLVAIWMSSRPPDHRMTFGYKRAEVIGAIMSIFGIWLLTAFLCYFSVSRLIQNDFDIEAHTMMLISGVGIVINVIMAFILHGSCSMPHGHSHGGGGHGHSHSHSPPTKQYKRLKSVSESSSHHHHHHHSGHQPANLLDTTVDMQQPSFIINGHLNNATGGRLSAVTVGARSDSICSYRSPSHSRTSSFSRPNSGGAGGAGSALLNGNSGMPSASASAAAATAHHAVLQMRLDDAISAADAENAKNARRHASAGDCHDGAAETAAAKRTNLNLQAAVIHVIGDFIQSVGVFIAAVVINYYPNAKIVDPLCTVLFSVIVMFTTVRIMRDSFAIIMDAVPADVDVYQLSGELASVPGVRAVHDLCVWSVTVGWPVMAVHLVVDPDSSAEKILASATELAREDFGIRHCTIQLERGSEQKALVSALHAQHGHRHSSHHEHRIEHSHSDAMIHFV